MKIDGWDMIPLPSNSIWVRATAKMDSSINASSYGLEYDAKIKNGEIETKDATGWTNRSGSRKYDWEHEALSSGSYVNISNYLYDYEDITTEMDRAEIGCLVVSKGQFLQLTNWTLFGPQM